MGVHCVHYVVVTTEKGVMVHGLAGQALKSKCDGRLHKALECLTHNCLCTFAQQLGPCVTIFSVLQYNVNY